MPTEQVLIEFISDTTSLDPAVDQLEKLGAISKENADIFRKTNAESGKGFSAISAGVSKVVTENKKAGGSIADLDARVKGLVKSYIDGFQKGIIEELKKAGLETRKFKSDTDKTTQSQVSLRTELRQLTEQLTKLKIEGKENSAQYQELSAKASKYRDALGDVSREINRAASDTRKLDTVIEFATGVAGAFSIAQGAVGLFGDKSEELQEVLLRVQSAMAVLNGLQSIQNILQKESNLIRLVTNQQLKLQVVVTNLQTAAQSKNIIVSSLAAGAMRVLNVVMAANPALILVSAFALLAGALVFFTGKSKESEEAVKDLSQALFDLNNNVDDAIAGVRNRAEIIQANLDLIGAKSSQKTKQRIADLRKENVEALTGLYKAQQQLEKLNRQVAEGVIKDNDKVTELRNKIIEDEHKYYDLVKDNNHKIKVLKINSIGEESDERKEASDKAIEEAKKLAEKQKELRLKGFEDFKASIDLQLLEVKKGSSEELALKKRLATVQLQIDLENDKLSQNQQRLAIQKFFKEREQQERDFAKRRREISLETRIADIAQELNDIDISSQAKEAKTIEFLERQRQLELLSVIDNENKKKEINAKFDKEIADQRLRIREEMFARELRQETAASGARKRAAERAASDENKDITKRIAAINELLRIELDRIDKQEANQRNLVETSLISQEEFATKYTELEDERAKATEEAEERIRKAKKKSEDDDKERTQKLAAQVIEVASLTIGILNSLYQLQSEKENIRIESQRERIKQLRETGAITEKESIARLKAIDREEKKLKHDQAVRDKQIAVFNAFLGIPIAYLRGLKDGGLPLAIIYAALAGIQAGITAARPIPKFGKGKKNSYEGIAQVGETGPELIERGGKMYVTDRPQIVWLSKKDKVYNPQETIAMMERPLPYVDKRMMNGGTNGHGFAIDYKKLGKAVGENIPQFGLTIDNNGFTQYMRDHMAFIKYLDHRRSF